MSGLVSFSALGSKQSQTFIDGGNIKTGTISADMINVNDLKVKTIWNYDNEKLIQTSQLERGVLLIGLTRNSYTEPDDSTAAYREISIYASRVLFLSPFATNKFNLCIDLREGRIYPYSLASTVDEFFLGTRDYPFDRFYGIRYYLGFSNQWGEFYYGYLQVVPGGGLEYVDENGTIHTIV